VVDCLTTQPYYKTGESQAAAEKISATPGPCPNAGKVVPIVCADFPQVCGNRLAGLGKLPLQALAVFRMGKAIKRQAARVLPAAGRGGVQE
jgi:hypothetical protein